MNSNPSNARAGRLSSWILVSISAFAGLGSGQKARALPETHFGVAPRGESRIESSTATSSAISTAQREIVRFEFKHTVVKTARAVFLVGDLPELASGDVRRALRMNTADRVHWSVSVSLPARGSYSYRFIRRDAGPLSLSKKSNAVDLSEMLVGRPEDAGYLYPHKRVRLHTTIREPVLSWRVGLQPFQVAALKPIGPGRFDGEGHFEGSFGAAGTTVSYFLSSPGGGQREPKVGIYTTPLDSFFLQDGEVFTYVPASTVSPARRHTPLVKSYNSKILGKRRKYRVMLPRGYGQHLERRYPVLYIYDGQTIWDGVAPWDTDGKRMRTLVGQGIVGEMVVVAIDSPFLCLRLVDVVPPEDTLDPSLTGGCSQRGNATNFLTFISSELKGRIDRVYRTKPDARHTFLSGFSGGGILALVAGHDFGHVFGGVSAQSAAYLLAPNFTARMFANPATDTRFYLDVGDREPILAPDMLALADDMSWIKSYVADLATWVGFGQRHTYPEAGSRMQPMLSFLYPASREASGL